MSELDTLIEALLDPGDTAAPLALADWLAEHDDPRAPDARHLAAVEPVVPITAPAMEDADPMPMGCGPWWSICYVRRGTFFGVAYDAYLGTPQGDRLEDWLCGQVLREPPLGVHLES